MQILCKKFRGTLGLLLLGLLPMLMVACTDDESSEVVLYPDSNYLYALYPNDMAQNDSAAANLSHGVKILVHPEASYELSFDIDSRYDAPTLQLFRIYQNSQGTGYRYNQVRSLQPKIENGRYVYSFSCEESDRIAWATSLVLDDDYFPGMTPNVRLTGTGSYSDTLSINLIVVGNVASELNGFTLEELSANMLSMFRSYYSSIHIDTLYLNFANEHPTLGSSYPANEPWLAGYSSSDVMLTELGGWPGISNALDIVLVHYINTTGIMGYSNLFSGNLGGGDGSTIVIGAYSMLADGQMANSMDDIIHTALHEAGHFFGLRHTTATSDDIQYVRDGVDYGDYSNVEDGLDDTPYCPGLLKSGLYKTQNSIESDIYKGSSMGVWNLQGRHTSTGVASCPDAKNEMFPVAVVGVGYDGFTEQQLAIIRKTLMIYPH